MSGRTNCWGVFGSPALLISVALFAGNVLGFLRDALIAFHFGAGPESDAYFLALTLPSVLTIWLWNGLTASFVPIYADSRREGTSAEVFHAVFSNSTVMFALLAGIGVLASRTLVTLLAPGFQPAQLELAVGLSQVMMIGLLFTGLSGLLTGLLNYHQSFLSPALKALVNNLVVMLVLLFFVPHLGIRSLALGFVAGSVAQVAVMLPAMRKLGLGVRWHLNLRSTQFWRMLSLAGPLFIGLAVSQLNLIIARAFSTSLPEGSLTAYSLANNLVLLPGTIFAASVATVAFPKLVEFHAGGDSRGFTDCLSKALETIAFIALPATVLLVSLRGPILTALFQRGQFDGSAVAATGAVLLYLGLGILALSALQIVLKAYYALRQTWVPVWTGVLVALVNIAASSLAVPRWGLMALALIGAGVPFLQLGILLLGLRRHVRWEPGTLLRYGRLILAALPLVLFCGVAERALQILAPLGAPGLFLGLVAVGLGGTALYVATCLALGSEAAQRLLNGVSRRFGRN